MNAILTTGLIGCLVDNINQYLEWLKEADEQQAKSSPGSSEIFSHSKRCATIQFIGCELILLEDGHWFMNDTSGG